MSKFVERTVRFLFSKNIKLIEVLILGVLISAVYINNLLGLELQPDETFWIVSAGRLDKLLAFDFKSPYWSEDLYLAFEVRPISSYLVGMGLKLGGIKADELPIGWDWQLSYAANISLGAFPSQQILFWSRIPLTLISIFSILGIMLLLARSHSRLAAYLFAFVSFNSYFLVQLRRALSEPPQILFTVLVLYASYKLLVAIQRDSIKNVVMWSAIAGAFSGLAAESKLTGIACAGIAVLGTMILMSDREVAARISKRRIPVIVAMVVGCATLLTFIGSYPFFYEQTATRIRDTLYTRKEIAQYQVVQYAYQAIQPGHRLTTLFQRIFKYPLDFHLHPVWIFLFSCANFFLTLFGIVYSIQHVRQRTQGWEYFAVFLVGTFLCAVPMLFTPLDWERYYLYPVFFSCIFFCIGAGELIFILVSNIQKRPDEELARLESLQD